MPNGMLRRALAGALLLAPSLAAAQADPVRADVPRDPARPPAMEELKIPSHGTRMNGFIYLAQGEGAHPVVVFLHGYPGNERNLDLAQAARRAGWHALYFDYRGSWGSGGTFSFQNALDDVGAAIGFLRESRERFGIDTSRVALVGHSMGGWLALRGAAAGSDQASALATSVFTSASAGIAARSGPPGEVRSAV